MIKVTNPDNGADILDRTTPGGMVTIKVGESKVLPDAVAHFLFSVYQFLVLEVHEEEEKSSEEVKDEVKKEDDGLDALSKDELTVKAIELEIDVKAFKKKQEIIDAIRNLNA